MGQGKRALTLVRGIYDVAQNDNCDYLYLDNCFKLIVKYFFKGLFVWHLHYSYPYHICLQSVKYSLMGWPRLINIFLAYALKKTNPSTFWPICKFLAQAQLSFKEIHELIFFAGLKTRAIVVKRINHNTTLSYSS